MTNPIKYNTVAESLSLKKGNFWIGTKDVAKGPTSATGFYAGISPPSGGYSVYFNKPSGGPAVYCPANDSELISFTNLLTGGNYSNVEDCLNYFAAQSDVVVINKNYENIITNGLVINLDASYVPSYPRTGTSWYDVSANSWNGTLINGPLYTSTNGGSLSFDGTDDYAEVINTSLNSYSSITVEILANVSDFSVEGMFFGFTSYDVYVRNVVGVNSGFGYNTGAGDLYGIPFSDLSALQNNWVYYTFVMVNNTSSGSNPYTNNKIYINGEERTLTQQRNSQAPSVRTFASKLTVNGWNNGTGYRVPMNYSFVRVYNRTLSPFEIYKNFITELGTNIVTDGTRLITSWTSLANLTYRTANAVVAPDGTMTATLFERVSISPNGHAQLRQALPTIDLLPSTKYNVSFWAKRIALTQVLNFDFSDTPQQVINLTADWKFYSFSLTTGATFPVGEFIDIGSSSVAGGSQLGEQYSIWNLHVSLV